MFPASRQKRTKTEAGFTLIELLLVVVLILLLMGASVFNFSSLQSDGGLNEGGTQFEALLRFARAHAQTTGRNVILRFDAAMNTPTQPGVAPSLVGSGMPHVLWEPDPQGQPGRFEDVFEAQFYLNQMGDKVRVERWHWGASSDPPPGAPKPELEPEPPTTDADGAAIEPPPVRFFPDGSSDSFEVDLVARDAINAGRLRLRVEGITGGLTREFIRSDESGAPEVSSEQKPADSREPEQGGQ